MCFSLICTPRFSVPVAQSPSARASLSSSSPSARLITRLCFLCYPAPIALCKSVPVPQSPSARASLSPNRPLQERPCPPIALCKSVPVLVLALCKINHPPVFPVLSRLCFLCYPAPIALCKSVPVPLSPLASRPSLAP